MIRRSETDISNPEVSKMLTSKPDFDDPNIVKMMDEHQGGTFEVLPSGFISDYQNKWASLLTMEGVGFEMFDEDGIKSLLAAKPTYREWLEGDQQAMQNANLDGLTEVQQENIAKVDQLAQKYNDQITGLTAENFDEQKFQQLKEISRAAVEIITKANDQA